MTDEDFYHTCALRVMEVLLSKIPVPSLPGGNQDVYARQNFVRGLARDSFEVALAMLSEKRFQPLPAADLPGRTINIGQLGGSLTGIGEAIRVADGQEAAMLPNVTPG